MSKIKLQKTLDHYLSPNHFWINNPFYLYTVYISIATLAMPVGLVGSTYMTKLKKLTSRQKHSMRIICNKGTFEHTKEFFQILSVYRLNILNFVTFICKFNQKAAPNIFLSRFQKPSYYPSTFSELNYVQPINKIKTTKY